MLKKNDFKDMEFDPFAPFGETPIFKHFRRLGTHDVFSNIPDVYAKKVKPWTVMDLSTLLKYVIVFIARDSPLWEERDFVLRKSKAIEALKIKSGSSVFQEIEEEGVLFHDFVFEFFKMINSHLYEQWFTTKIQVQSFNKYLRTKPDPEDILKEMTTRKMLQKDMDGFSKALIKMEAKLFDDETLAELISDSATQNAIGGYAEKYADDPEWLHEQM